MKSSVGRRAALRFEPGDLGGRFLQRDRIALLLGEIDPVLHVVRVGRREAHVCTQRRQLRVFLAVERLQRPALVLEVVLRRDLLRHDEVEARLRLVRVDDGRGADLEITLGLGQLLGNRRFLRPHQPQRVLRREHVEVGL